MVIIEDLDKVYKNGSIEVKALKQINFAVREGEFVSIMGPSGSGKSTMMNIIGCLDKMTSGKYLLDGIDIAKTKDKDLSEIRNKKIGFVFQSFNLLPKLTAFENVELPMIYAGLRSKQRKTLAIEALEKVGLADRMKHKPSEISGGQRQRVAIARAIATNPSIILADEPTGNLDSHSGEEIMKIFDDLNNEGSTIIMVTHEKYIAEKAKRIAVFKDGIIISDHIVNKSK